jgi:hypothetical protein
VRTYLKFLEVFNVGPGVLIDDLVRGPVRIRRNGHLRRHEHNTASSIVFRGTEDAERALHRRFQQLFLIAADSRFSMQQWIRTTREVDLTEKRKFASVSSACSITGDARWKTPRAPSTAGLMEAGSRRSIWNSRSRVSAPSRASKCFVSPSSSAKTIGQDTCSTGTREKEEERITEVLDGGVDGVSTVEEAAD